MSVSRKKSKQHLCQFFSSQLMRMKAKKNCKCYNICSEYDRHQVTITITTMHVTCICLKQSQVYDKWELMQDTTLKSVTPLFAFCSVPHTFSQSHTWSACTRNVCVVIVNINKKVVELGCAAVNLSMIKTNKQYSVVQWNWFSNVTGCTWVTCIPVTSENQFHCTKLYFRTLSPS